MLAWISELTDMNGWEKRIWDDDFVFKWKSTKVIAGGDVTRAMADWVNLLSGVAMAILLSLYSLWKRLDIMSRTSSILVLYQQ